MATASTKTIAPSGISLQFVRLTIAQTRNVSQDIPKNVLSIVEDDTANLEPIMSLAMP